jgi:hypothetical protein
MLKMEAVHSSETLVNFYQTAWHLIPEDSTLHYLLVTHSAMFQFKRNGVVRIFGTRGRRKYHEDENIFLI